MSSRTIGDRSIGAHRLVAGLGTGGMARVYLALAQKPGGFTKLLVLKVMRGELDADGDFLQMFMQEARLTARLNHPNVVQTYEFGEDANRHYIAMEYLEGQPLSSVLGRLGREKFPLDVHLRILCDVLEGLHYAHELVDYDGTPLNIVHRDVSPQNVFVTYTGQSKVLDFGVAKVSGSARTVTGVLKGKIGYMAPEQAAGQFDRRADVFGVGVMLWEAIARQRFIERGEDDVVVLTRRMAGSERGIRAVAPEAPAELMAICEKAMALNPEERFASAAAMRDALEGYLSKSEPVDARRVAALLDQSFADERARIRALIDDQVRRADDTGPMIDIQIQASMTPPARAAARRDSTPEVGAPVVTVIRPARRVPVVPLVVLAVAVMGGVAALAIRRVREPQAEAASFALVSPPGASSAPAEPPPSAILALAPATITVAIRTTPPNATLLVDGEAVKNPYRVEVANDGSRHTIQASARGHAAETTSVAYDGPQDVVVTLKAATGAAGPRSAPTDVDVATAKSKRPKRTVDEKDPYQ